MYFIGILFTKNALDQDLRDVRAFSHNSCGKLLDSSPKKEQMDALKQFFCYKTSYTECF